MIKAPGHVGLLSKVPGTEPGMGDVVRIVGGNQGDALTEAAFPVEDILGIRRLGIR